MSCLWRFLLHICKNVFKNVNNNNVERIESKLKIHGYSAEGESIMYELYVAEFSKVGNCFLPKTIKFFSDDDFDYKMPVITMEISYKLK